LNPRESFKDFTPFEDQYISNEDKGIDLPLISQEDDEHEAVPDDSVDPRKATITKAQNLLNTDAENRR